MHHEPCEKHEHFVGNDDKPHETLAWLHSQGASTARLGSVAYDIDGNVLPLPYLPVFVRGNRYHEVMMEKTFGPDWHRRYN